VTTEIPSVVEVRVTVRCKCGEERVFPDVRDGWQHVRVCPCGRYLAVQVPDTDPVYVTRALAGGWRQEHQP
jgi:hypothetical protein